MNNKQNKRHEKRKNKTGLEKYGVDTSDRTPEDIVWDSMKSYDENRKKLNEDIKKEVEGLKSDSRLKSVSESFMNIAVGFPINYGANIAILPFYADHFGTPEEILVSSFQIGIWFTLVSIVRSYGLRRLFNHYGEKENGYTLTIRFGKWIIGGFKHE